MTLIASSSQRSYPSELPKLPPHHYGIFQGTLQKPHLQILGSLLFCVGLTLSKPAWSAPQVGSAALSVSPPNPKESVVTTTSTEAIPSNSAKQGTGEGERGTEPRSFSLPSSPPECMEYSKLEPSLVDSKSQRGLTSPAHTSFQWTEAFVELGVHPFPFRNGYSALREPTQETKTSPAKAEERSLVICQGINASVSDDETGATSDAPAPPIFLGQPASNSVAKITRQQPSNSKTPRLLTEIKSIPSSVENGNSPSQSVKPVPNAEQQNTNVQEFRSSAKLWSSGKTGVGGTEQEFISHVPEESKDSIAPFQMGLEFSSERMSEQLLSTRLLSDDPSKSPHLRLQLKKETLNGWVPPLTRAKGDEILSNTSQTSSQRNSELFVQSQSFPGENNPESEQSGNSEDPELGILRLRELPTPPPPAKPAVYLLGGAGYFRSNNIFSAVEPLDDGLFRAGVTLLAVPSLGPQTSVFASVGGNIIRYTDLSDYNYDELRFSAGIRQQIGSRTYGELGWLNRQLFSEEGGDRFLNDHSVYLELGRRDPLTRQLALDTYYQLRLSVANPSDRSQLINALGASLAYYPFPALEAALDYQFARADFTQQERDDQYHQLIARLTYTLSRNSRFYLFGGRSFGDSSDEYTDFDGWVFGAGVDLNLVLF